MFFCCGASSIWGSFETRRPEPFLFYSRSKLCLGGFNHLGFGLVGASPIGENATTQVRSGLVLLPELLSHFAEHKTPL